MSTRVIGGEGGGAAPPPPPSATRHSSSSISSSSSSSEQEPDNCHGEDAQEDDDDEEEEEEEEQQQQQHNGHGGDGGFVPNPAKKQRQQYRATESAKKQQTTRDLRITSTLLHPEHSMALGVWTSTGHVKSCSKGIGTDIKLRILSPRANSNPLLLPYLLPHTPTTHPPIPPPTTRAEAAWQGRPASVSVSCVLNSLSPSAFLFVVSQHVQSVAAGCSP